MQELPALEAHMAFLTRTVEKYNAPAQSAGASAEVCVFVHAESPSRLFVLFCQAAGVTGVLASLQLALVGAAPPPVKPCVKIGEAQKNVSLEKLEPATWPTSKLTDDLRDAVDALKKKGVLRPFIFIEITKKALPAWAMVGFAKDPQEKGASFCSVCGGAVSYLFRR